MQHPPPQKSGPAAFAAYAALRLGLTVPSLAGLGPSREAARSLGRRFGAAPFNRKRIDRAAAHMAVALPDRDEAARRELALRSYEHLAMLAVEVAFIPRLLTPDGWIHHVEVGPMLEPLRRMLSGRPLILITGHCGNWEVLGATVASIGFPVHALYRPLDLRPVDNWLRESRARSGIYLIDKFGAARHLPPILERGGSVGFVADQNAGDRGIFVPFFGRLASSYKAIGLLAMAHDATVMCGQARRLPESASPAGDEPESDPPSIAAPAQRRQAGGPRLRYRLEIEDVIPPDEYQSAADPLFYLTARYRRAIEAMVRRAPEQYLWMHRIWKSRPRHERHNQPFPPPLARKLRDLPWLGEQGAAAVIEQSDRDRAELARTGRDRLA